MNIVIISTYEKRIVFVTTFPLLAIIDFLIGHESEEGDFQHESVATIPWAGKTEDNHHIFSADIKPEKAGVQTYMIRMYPYHKYLSQRFEVGCMRWLRLSPLIVI